MNFINADKLIKQCEANISLYQKTIDAELAHLSEARDMYSLIRTYAKKEAEEDIILRIKMELNQFSVDTSNQNQNQNISIAVVPPTTHGYWIQGYDDCNIPLDFNCSICNAANDFKTDYCPNCGAKMDKV